MKNGAIMAIRPQIKEYKLDINKHPELGLNGSGRVALGDERYNRPLISLKATEYMVINRVGCSQFIMSSKDDTVKRPARIFVQVRLNTTDYFVDDWRGVSNNAYPFPFPDRKAKLPEDIDIYVLPGQDISFVVNMDGNTRLGEDEFFYVAVDYMLYDGTDCIFANSCLERGLLVCPENIDMLKARSIGVPCEHGQYYIVYNPSNVVPDICDVDVANVRSLHEAIEHNNVIVGDEWHKEHHEEYELYCKLCHEKLPSIALTKAEYEKKFILPKKEKEDAEEQG